MDVKVKKYREYFNSLLLKSILVYLLINIVAIIVFWTTRPVYGSNYVIYIFYITLPLSGFIIAILNSIRGFNLVTIVVMELLLYGICTIHNNVTFELSRALDTGIFEVRLYEYDLPVIVMSCFGLLVGAIYRLLKFHKFGRK